MNGAAEQLAIPHGVTEKGIQITLMYSKSSQQVLFVEAGKDFVDLVVGFLTLPIGCVIKLLSESESVEIESPRWHANIPVLMLDGLLRILKLFSSNRVLEVEET